MAAPRGKVHARAARNPPLVTREERSDEAIQSVTANLLWIASLRSQ
jgi:hypothetical protein